MDTRFDICSRALTRVGLKPIVSFEEGTAEAIVAGREYEALVAWSPPRRTDIRMRRMACND